MSEEINNSAVRKVLLAEDDEFLSKVLEAKLAKEGFAVTRVADGEQVIEALSKESFSIILLDLIMPKMNGFDVLSKLQADHNSTPVIVTSNLGSDSDMSQVKALGAKKYFVKSDAPMSDIVDGIKSILGGGGNLIDSKIY